MSLLHPQENSCFIVPPLKNETMKQNPKTRNNERNTGETQSLKVLALKVLQRNNTRNKSETSPINEVEQTPLKNGLLFHSKKADFCPLDDLTVNIQDRLKARPMTRATKCNKCLHWTPKRGSCYWMGTCALDGGEVGINSKCRTNFADLQKLLREQQKTFEALQQHNKLSFPYGGNATFNPRKGTPCKKIF